jgi:hypothetical protein
LLEASQSCVGLVEGPSVGWLLTVPPLPSCVNATSRPYQPVGPTAPVQSVRSTDLGYVLAEPLVVGLIS